MMNSDEKIQIGYICALNEIKDRIIDDKIYDPMTVLNVINEMLQHAKEKVIE